MVWDCLIGWVILLFTLIGWGMGLVRMWTVPFSMAIATFISQHLYIDAATILVETLHLEPTFSVFISYVFTWFWIAQYCNFFLWHVIRIGDQNAVPPMWSNIIGALLGFAKGAGGFVLAAMVTYAQNQVPEPPEVCWENRWIVHSARDSYLLPKVHYLANELDPKIGKYVLSESAPRFHPNFALGNDPLAPVMERERERGRKIYRNLKYLQNQFDNF